MSVAQAHSALQVSVYLREYTLPHPTPPTHTHTLTQMCDYDLDRSVQLISQQVEAGPSHQVPTETQGASPGSASRTSGDGAVAVSVVDQATGTEHSE